MPKATLTPEQLKALTKQVKESLLEEAVESSDGDWLTNPTEVGDEYSIELHKKAGTEDYYISLSDPEKDKPKARFRIVFTLIPASNS